MGPFALCLFPFGLRLHALDNYQFRVRRGLAQRLRLGVFWRSPPLSRPLHARKLADDQPFARPLSLENLTRATAGNESPTVFLHGWHHHPFVILEPNRIFDRKTCNDIDRHVFSFIQVIDNLAVEGLTCRVSLNGRLLPPAHGASALATTFSGDGRAT